MLDLTHLHSHGVFLRREALRAGYDDKDIQAALRSGSIARVRHGAYAAAQTWSSSDDVQRHRLRCHAVMATHGGSVALSHTSAAIMHGLAVWGADLDRVHVTRLDGRTDRVSPDVRYHRGHLADHVLEEIAPAALVTTRARAALDHASVCSVESGLVTLDSFLHHAGSSGFTELEELLEARRGWPGARRLQITLRLTRYGAESVGESRMRFLCFEQSLPEPELQVEVHDAAGALVGISDFGWPGRSLLSEFDGRVKYEKFLRPGETSADAVSREKRREDRMREASGCAMIRFTWADLYDRDRTAARLRHALKIA